MPPSPDDLRVTVARLESRLEEREKHVATRFHAVESAAVAALAAQKELVAAAFLASDKAITKAEQAQRDYNVHSNEFRGQLDDQAKMLMPREEALALIRSVEDKVAATNADREKKFDALTRDIAFLREQRMASVGARDGNRRLRDDSKAWTAIAIAVLSTVITIVTILLKLGAAAAPPPYVPAPLGTTVPITPVTRR